MTWGLDVRLYFFGKSPVYYPICGSVHEISLLINLSKFEQTGQRLGALLCLYTQSMTVDCR